MQGEPVCIEIALDRDVMPPPWRLPVRGIDLGGGLVLHRDALSQHGLALMDGFWVVSDRATGAQIGRSRDRRTAVFRAWKRLRQCARDNGCTVPELMNTARARFADAHPEMPPCPNP